MKVDFFPRADGLVATKFTGLVTAKLRETAAHVIAMSVLALNLRKIQCAFLQFLTYLLAVFPSKEKWAIVQ